VRVDQRLGETVDKDAVFRDESGQNVRLGSYFGERPVILALVYNRCPMLCNQVLSGLVASLKVVTLEPGSDFEVVVVSFDPEEAPELARAQKAKVLERYGRDGAARAVHFLTGDEKPIRELADAVGFRYEYDEKLGQYAHPSAIMVLTPGGEVSRYFFGSEFSPRDLRWGLVEASQGKVGDVSDDLLLLCYRYDPVHGTYSATALGAIRVGGALVMLVLGGFIVMSLRRERRERRTRAARPPPARDEPSGAGGSA
jgi:protein SCO1/2